MRKTPGKTIAARERYWTKIIEEARKYPKGITEYCRVMNVSKNNYYFWFKRLRPKHPEWHDLTNHPEVIKPQASAQDAQPEPRPETEVHVRTRRKKWTLPEKERILKEAEGLSGRDLGAFIRREGLYVHTLTKWRTEQDLMSIAKQGTKNDRLAEENKRLREKNAQLQKKLDHQNEIILIQKKYQRCSD
jgi:transposase-like protein